MTLDNELTARLEALTIELEAESADEPQPGDSDVPFSVGTVIHKPTGDAPFPMAVSHVSSAGYTYVYDIRTGDRSVVNNNMLAAQLRKSDPETGTRIFTTRKPDITPFQGKHKCYLHKDALDRPKYDQMGFAACHKSNLASEFHLERHMAAKHKSEWSAIKQAQDKAEKTEERDFQRALMAALVGEKVRAQVLDDRFGSEVSK